MSHATWSVVALCIPAAVATADYTSYVHEEEEAHLEEPIHPFDLQQLAAA